MHAWRSALGVPGGRSDTALPRTMIMFLHSSLCSYENVCNNVIILKWNNSHRMCSLKISRSFKVTGRRHLEEEKNRVGFACGPQRELPPGPKRKTRTSFSQTHAPEPPAGRARTGPHGQGSSATLKATRSRGVSLERAVPTGACRTGSRFKC